MQQLSSVLAGGGGLGPTHCAKDAMALMGSLD